MKAVVFKGQKKISVEQVEEPEIVAPTDAIIRVTSAAISEADIHVYQGETSAKDGLILGHEIIGIVDSIGVGVTSISEDDRVVLPFNIGCGYCLNCRRGYISACLTTNPQGIGSTYGYPGMGEYQGGQAEYVSVPFADFNCLKIPGEPYDQWEDDFLLISDVFSSGYQQTELTHVKTGSTVAIFGANAYGLMIAYSSVLKGAAEVYVADTDKIRLNKAKEIGAIPIDSNQDPVEQIINWRKINTSTQASLLPGENKMIGVMAGIDATGDNRQALENLIKVVNSTGLITVINPLFDSLPCVSIDKKKLFISNGLVSAQNYARSLRNLIIAGRAKPSFIVSKEFTLDQAPSVYENITKNINSYTKIVLRTGLAH